MSSISRSTERFSRQHAELGALSKALLKELDTGAIAADPMKVKRALASFSGRLRVHAAMEQQALYPRLLASSDATVAAKARSLLDEIGGIYDGFYAYLAAWSRPNALEADVEGFCRETMRQLFQLGARMKREDDELYPLVDALDAKAS
ncbi:MAG TPA: hemerythrin domain-containing protein [Byssovorax sp.]|jgi:hypothetical protein